MSPQVQPPTQRTPRRRRPLDLAFRAVAVVGLAIDAYVHLALAGDYDANAGDLIGQGALFRIEAAASIVAALLVLVVHRRATDTLVLVVAASAAVVALVYRYVDLGPVFGLPDLYEPIWYPQKVLTTIAEVVAALAALALLRSRSPVARDEHP